VVKTCIDRLAVTNLMYLLLLQGAIGVTYKRILFEGQGIHEPCRESLVSHGLLASKATAGSLDTLAAMLDLTPSWSKDGLESRLGPCNSSSLPSEVLGRYGTDKGPDGHAYTRLYDLLFQTETIRCSVTDVLEVGLGTINPNAPASMKHLAREGGWEAHHGVKRKLYETGASLRAWRELFPRAQVVGLDIDRSALFGGPRLKTHQCNTLNATCVHNVLFGRKFDLIVDDGLHTETAQQGTLLAAWPHLRMGGLYIIEDVGVEVAETFVDGWDGVVLMNTGASGNLILRLKTSEAPPAPLLTIPHLEKRLVRCMQTFQWLDFGACCGRGGTFLPKTVCFRNNTMTNECCTMWVLVTDPRYVRRGRSRRLR